MTAGIAPRTTKQQRRLRNVDRIVIHRDRLMAEVTQLRERGGSLPIVEKVQQLLTRWWSPANWHAREELLKTAEWFLRLETEGGGNVPAKRLLATAKPDKARRTAR